MVNLEVRKEDIPFILDGLLTIAEEEEDYIQHYRGPSIAAKITVNNINNLIDSIFKQYIALKNDSR